MNNCGLFLSMARRCFCLGVLLDVWFAVVGCVVFVCFSLRFYHGFVVCFWVFGKVANVFKMLAFPFWGVFLGLFYSCLLGFERFRVRWGPLFCFVFCLILSVCFFVSVVLFAFVLLFVCYLFVICLFLFVSVCFCLFLFVFLACFCWSGFVLLILISFAFVLFLCPLECFGFFWAGGGVFVFLSHCFEDIVFPAILVFLGLMLVQCLLSILFLVLAFCFDLICFLFQHVPMLFVCVVFWFQKTRDVLIICIFCSGSFLFF